MDLQSLFALAWPVMLKGTGYTRLFAVVSMILGLPMWWAYAFLAPGLALTAVIAVVQAVRR